MARNAIVEVLDRLVAEFGGCLKQAVQSGDGADARLNRDQKQVRGDERVVGEHAQDQLSRERLVGLEPGPATLAELAVEPRVALC